VAASPPRKCALSELRGLCLTDMCFSSPDMRSCVNCEMSYVNHFYFYLCDYNNDSPFSSEPGAVGMEYSL
jgi:hypothetical protein